MPPEDERARLVREWMQIAERDLRGAMLMEQAPELFDLAAFHCQQAAEKALKGFLTQHDRPYRRTHDLTELLRQCSEIDPAFAAFVDAARTLTPFAGDVRYPGVVDVPPEQAAAALSMATELVRFVAARLPKAGQP
jgi:HEPN domain-containing protein